MRRDRAGLSDLIFSLNVDVIAWISTSSEHTISIKTKAFVCVCVLVCTSRRWQDCNSKWQKFVSDQKALEEWLNDAESTLKLGESEPAAHRQHLRVTHTHTDKAFSTNMKTVSPHTHTADCTKNAAECIPIAAESSVVSAVH